MSWVNELARPEIVALKPYEHASWEPTLERLHANELPWRALGDNTGAGLNRYPEPQPRELVIRLAALYDVAPETLLVSHGSDEAIDLLTRTFCRAGEDAIICCPPTFGMYAVAARIQGAEVISVPLVGDRGFALDEQAVLDAWSPRVKLVFLCSPNNPTGNLLDERAVLRIASALARRALVVVDEAYLEFSGTPSLARHIAEMPQLAVLRTLSKAYGLAGARCGVLVADSHVLALVRKVRAPYSVSQLAVEAALKLLEPPQLAIMKARLELLRSERDRMRESLQALPGTVRVWPSDANFLLAEFTDPDRAFSRIRAAGLLVRDVRGQRGLENALRITLGTIEQNNRVLEALR